MDIWLVCTSNQLFTRGFYTEVNSSNKQRIDGKTLFFVKGLFCTPHFIVLPLAFSKVLLHKNIAFAIVVLSSEKWYSSFLKSF